MTRTVTSTLVTTYTYDVANRLAAQNGQSLFTWDANGNLTSDGSKTYNYDQANRLTGVSATGLAWSATYNGDGVRLRQVVGGVPTTYTLDLAAPLVQVLMQQDGNGATRYLYGVMRVGEQQSAGWVYHLPDAPLREDWCQLKKGHAPRAMAVINNLIVGLVLRLGYTNLAAARRYFDAHPQAAQHVVLHRLA